MANKSLVARRAPFSFKKLLTKWGTVLFIVLMLIVFSAAMPNTFPKLSNFVTIFRNISIVTVAAMAITSAVVVNGFDLSLGSTVTLADAVVMSMLVWYARSTGVAIIVALLAVMVVGLVNGLLIVKFHVNDTLATLASMFIFAGVAMTYSGGGAISVNMMHNGQAAPGTIPASFKAIGQTPWIIIIMLVIVAFMHIFLTKTKYGRYLYAVGGNKEAAKLAGIPVGKYQVLAYLLSAFFSGIAGIMLCSRVGSFQINAGEAYLMPAIAAAFIGESVGGAGKANAIGTFIGAVLIGILENGLIMLSVPYYALNIIKGIVLAFALALTFFRDRR